MTIAGQRSRTLDELTRAPNALNLVRLALAIAVLVSHSGPLGFGGDDVSLLGHSLGGLAVQGFFFLSGVLIATSYLNRPEVRGFLARRAARIMPAYVACLIVTGIVIIPLIALAEGASPTHSLRRVPEYLVLNLGLVQVSADPFGLPTRTSYPGAINGSLWTLAFEAACYLGILVLGTMRLLRKWGAVVPLIVLFTAGRVLLERDPSLDRATNGPYTLRAGCTLAVCFLTGVLCLLAKDHLTFAWPWMLFAALGWLGSLSAKPVEAAVLSPVAIGLLGYVLLVLGAMLPPPPFRADLSYGTYVFAFPVQQLCAVWKVPSAGTVTYLVVTLTLTLLLATASWFAIERPILRRVGARLATPR